MQYVTCHLVPLKNFHPPPELVAVDQVAVVPEHLGVREEEPPCSIVIDGGITVAIVAVECATIAPEDDVRYQIMAGQRMLEYATSASICQTEAGAASICCISYTTLWLVIEIVWFY